MLNWGKPDFVRSASFTFIMRRLKEYKIKIGDIQQTKTPFTRYRIQMNPICFRNVLVFRLHDADDEHYIKSIRT